MERNADTQLAAEITGAFRLLSNCLICRETDQQAPVTEEDYECNCLNCQVALDEKYANRLYNEAFKKTGDPLIALYMLSEEYPEFVEVLVDDSKCIASDLRKPVSEGCKCLSCSSRAFLLDMSDKAYERADEKGL